MNVINNGEHPDHQDDHFGDDLPAKGPTSRPGEDVVEEAVDGVVDQRIDVLVSGAGGRLRAAVAEANEQGRLTIDLPTAGSGSTGSSGSSTGGLSTDAGDMMTDRSDREPPETGKLDVGAYEIAVDADWGGPLPDRDPVAERDDESVIVLSGSPRPRDEKPRRRRSVLAAAVVLVLALVGLGVWQLGGGGDDESSGAVAGDPGPRYLVAGELPDGFEPLHAEEDPGLPGEGAGTEITFTQGDADLVVYGDSDPDDPWNGPIAVLSRWEADSPDHWEQVDEGQEEYENHLGDVTEWETVSRGGRVWEVVLEPDGSELGDVLSARHTEGAVRLELVTYGLDRRALLSAAEHVGDSFAIGGAGLPDDFEELARGPYDLAVPGWVGSGGSFTAFTPGTSFSGVTGGVDSTDLTPGGLDGLAVAYSDADGEFIRSGDGALAVQTLPEVDEQALPLPNLYLYLSHNDVALPASPSGEIRTWDLDVRSQPAVAQELPTITALAHFGFLTVQWFEPEIDALVVVTARDVDEDQVFSFIDSLREAQPGEIDALLENHEPRSFDDESSEVEAIDTAVEPVEPPEDIPVIDFGALDETGPVSAVDGEAGGLPWSLGHYEHEHGPLLLFDQGPGTNGDGTTMFVDFDATPGGQAQAGRASVGSDRQVPVYGYAPPEAEEVALTSPDGERHPLDLHPMEGVDAQMFMGWVPFTDGLGVVRALDGAGEPLAGWPQTVGLDRDFG